jgi:transcriptional regulator with XRE-family HTH domain
MPLARRVGARIKRDRIAKGWTQLDLANALRDRGGPSYSSRVSLWETTKSLPSEDHRLLLADVLDQPAERYFALFQPDDDPPA